MKKVFLIFFYIFFAKVLFSQVAQWNLTTNNLPSNVNSALEAGNFTKGTGISDISFSSSGAAASQWSATTLDSADYFQISISAKNSYKLNISEIRFSERRSLSGILNYQVQYSKNLDFSNVTTISEVTIPDNDLERDGNITNLNIEIHGNETLYIRFLGYSAESSVGTWRINDNSLQIFGEISVENQNDNTSQVLNPPSQIAGTQIFPSQSFEIFKFLIKDLGTQDSLPTKVSKMKFYATTSNSTNYKNIIENISLFQNKNSVLIDSVKIDSNFIEVFLPQNSLIIPNHSQTEITFGVTFKTQLEDKKIFQIKIDSISHGFFADISGSGFAKTFENSVTSNIFQTEIVAKQLQFSFIPTNILICNDFQVKISAVDEFFNTDKDFNNSVTLSLSTGNGHLTSKTSLTKNFSQGICQFIDLQYDTAETFSLKAASTNLQNNEILSNSITCSESIFYFNENFENTNLENWFNSQDWQLSDFQAINGNFSLKHNSGNGKSFISHKLQNIDFQQNTIWRFKIKNGEWDPSSTNKFWFYLFANDSNLHSITLNGYAVGVDFSGSSDLLTLWKVQNGTPTSLITSNLDWSENQIAAIEILRTKDGIWELKYNNTGIFEHLTSAGTSYNVDFQEVKYCGLVFEYTASRAGWLWLDDIYIGMPIPDRIPPQIDTLEARKPNLLCVKFSEQLDSASALLSTNYKLNESLNPTKVEFENSLRNSVLLTFSINFNNGQNYSLVVDNVRDTSYNKMISQTKNFVYTNFSVSKISVISANQIDIKFSKNVDSISSQLVDNYKVNNNINSPYSVFRDSVDKSLVHLIFAKSFVEKQPYSLNISKVKDFYNVEIQSVTLQFLHYKIKFNDITFNEIMCDISPLPEGLPAEKYIELVNNTNYSLSLSDFSLIIGSGNPAILPANTTISPNGFLIICTEKSVSKFLPYGNVVGILKETELSSSGKTLIFKDKQQKIISQVSYSLDFYKDKSKSDGGFSMEKIDATNACSESLNWCVSSDYRGGTPGRKNSVQKTNRDTSEIKILSLKTESANHLVLTFNKHLNNQTLTSLNFILETSNPVKIFYEGEYPKVVHLIFENFFENNIEKSLKVLNIKDLCGNIIPETSLKFVYKSLFLKDFEIKSATQIKLYFSEKVEKNSAENVENYKIFGNKKPFSAILDAKDSSVVHLQFSTEFVEKQRDTLIIANIKDRNNFAINTSKIPFCYYKIKRFDLIINELMFDISPVPVGLPAFPYIEIFNSTDFDIYLSDFSLQISSTKKTFRYGKVKAHNYLIITTLEGAKQFSNFGDTLSLISESDLSTSSESLILLDKSGNFVDFVNYFNSWCRNIEKQNGGWSLERIDYRNVCGEGTNWRESVDIQGGTPARQNSVFAPNIDTLSPWVKEISVLSSKKLSVYFSKPLNNQTVTVQNFEVNKNIGFPKTILFDSEDKNLIYLIFEKQFFNDSLYTLTIRNVKDFCENQIVTTEKTFSHSQIRVLKVKVKSKNQLTIKFSEFTDSLSAVQKKNYFLKKISQNPSFAVQDSRDKSLIHLQFEKNFTQFDTLVLEKIADENGNFISKTEKLVVFYSAKRNDVIINEIMTEPSADFGLPEVEYIELFNNTNFPLDLSGWFLTVGESRKELIIGELAPNGFAIILDSRIDTSLFSNCNIIPVSTLSINNTSDFLKLETQNGNLIDFLEFNEDWYADSQKKDGGFSLERIDSKNFCNDENNWTASQDNSGGTPCRKNSVASSNPDEILPFLRNINFLNDSVLELFFNESLDSVSLANLLNYVVDNQEFKPVFVKEESPYFQKSTLYFSKKFVVGEIYFLSLKNIEDFSGNKVDSDNKFRFSIPQIVDSLDVIINEVLFDSYENGTDFIELYNNSQKVFNLKDIFFAVQSSDSSSVKWVQICKESQLFFPKEFKILTKSASGITNFYKTCDAKTFVLVSEMPSLSAEKGIISISSHTKKIVDKFSYYQNFHFALLDETKGVSLERLNYQRVTGDKNNWHSASSIVGYATPGLENSQFTENSQQSDEINVSPEVFSPDNDGFQDVLTIHYKFSESGYVANIKIFDSKGREIRNLCRNNLLGTEGDLTWDGLDNSNLKAPLGIYVLFLEVFDLQGDVKIFKKVCVVGGKF